MAEATQRLVELDDGVSLNIAEVGSGHPLILLHGPGFEHRAKLGEPVEYWEA